MVNSAMHEIHEEKDIEFNSLVKWQPMKTEQNWCDVISFVGPSNETYSRILDHLQLIQQTLSRALL